ncbi:marvel domain-containing protein [Apiospora rasikravindrae]|uniref:Marvel domain-containing protein n=1 Tax=Apiospora rasikravindrae TaxID=990691 RepID=A0ABR1U9P2_9PEZI
MVLDGIAAVVYLVAGIILTSTLKHVSSCTSGSDDATAAREDNKVTNFGCNENDWLTNDVCIQFVKDTKSDRMKPRCQRAVTDYSFDFVGFTLCLLMVFLGHVLARRGGSKPTVAAQI